MENISANKPKDTGGKKALIQVIIFIVVTVLGTFAIKFLLDLLDIP